MVANDIRISQKMKNKGQLNIERGITKCKKMINCFRNQKGLSYPFTEMDTKISF